MSDTKWRKLISAVGASDLSIRDVVVKFVDVEEPRRIRFPPSLATHDAYMDTIEFGPVELRAIEWMDLPVEVEALLNALGRFPVEHAGTGLRIVGYRC